MANEWLDNLRVGDKVIVDGDFGEGFETTVKRFTPTLIVTDGGGRYRRKNGLSVRDELHRYLSKPTQKRLDKILHSRWVVKLQGYKWHKESLETLTKIVMILTDSKT